jgi:hypothetical protein
MCLNLQLKEYLMDRYNILEDEILLHFYYGAVDDALRRYM